jgi:multiple sugar transport system ATP-binding protein
MARVALENVEKVFANGVHALRELNLEIADGELLVLLGPSGSGKTTTLRLIAGLEQVTYGNVRIGGRRVTGLPPRERDVAMVFQRHCLYPRMTIRENLGFGLRLRQPVSLWSRAAGRFLPRWYAAIRQRDQVLKERVADAARMLDLEEVLEQRPHQLSGGQQQRAALGRALVRRPAVWLLDEPLSQLDAPLRAEIRRQLHLLHRRLPATIVYVTHDQVEAMALGDRITVLDRGKVQQIGRPGEIYQRPRNRFVAGFVGWPPMNFVDGRWLQDNGRLRFAADEFSVLVPEDTASSVVNVIGKGVTLGIRPEHVRVAAVPNGEATIAMKVTLVERLGSDTLMTLERGEIRMTARTQTRWPTEGAQTVEVVCDMHEAHWFDRDSGMTLTEVPTG